MYGCVLLVGCGGGNKAFLGLCFGNPFLFNNLSMCVCGPTSDGVIGV